MSEENENLKTENMELKQQIESHKKAHDHIENELLVISNRITTLQLQLKSAKIDPTKLFAVDK